MNQGIYDNKIHVYDGVSKELSTIDIDEVIAVLMKLRNEIIEKHPEAFEVTVDIGSRIYVNFIRNRTQEEINLMKKQEEDAKNFRYKQYLKLKEEFEGIQQ
jgi:hypothetical protein